MENERMFWLWSVTLNCLVAVTITDKGWRLPTIGKLFKEDITDIGSN